MCMVMRLVVMVASTRHRYCFLHSKFSQMLLRILLSVWIVPTNFTLPAKSLGVRMSSQTLGLVVTRCVDAASCILMFVACVATYETFPLPLPLVMCYSAPRPLLDMLRCLSKLQIPKFGYASPEVSCCVPVVQSAGGLRP